MVIIFGRRFTCRLFIDLSYLTSRFRVNLDLRCSSSWGDGFFPRQISLPLDVFLYTDQRGRELCLGKNSAPNQTNAAPSQLAKASPLRHRLPPTSHTNAHKTKSDKASAEAACRASAKARRPHPNITPHPAPNINHLPILTSCVLYVVGPAIRQVQMRQKAQVRRHRNFCTTCVFSPDDLYKEIRRGRENAGCAKRRCPNPYAPQKKSFFL
ncbi:MAG: hypothetical protein S4CHLAM102_03010 [Chlamydiia bacterium]|nr:hypothetical protein [Chlamydiia bacterium]